jgi:precorrin-6B methylase 2
MKAVFGLLSSDTRHAWIQTVNAPRLKTAPLGNIYPWFSFPSLDYLNKHISSDMQVLEFGCGYSTIWWAQRVSRVTSIERSTHWISEVSQALSKHAMVNVELIPFSEFTGTTEEEIQAEAEPIALAPIVQRYVSAGRGKAELYDVVVIDDVFRNEVAAAAIPRLKPGGMLVLDDSERPRYSLTFDLLKRMGWSFASFHGATPYHFHEKSTTIWHKPIQT